MAISRSALAGTVGNEAIHAKAGQQEAHRCQSPHHDADELLIDAGVAPALSYRPDVEHRYCSREPARGATPALRTHGRRTPSPWKRSGRRADEMQLRRLRDTSDLSIPDVGHHADDTHPGDGLLALDANAFTDSRLAPPPPSEVLPQRLDPAQPHTEGTPCRVAVQPSTGCRAPSQFSRNVVALVSVKGPYER